MREEMKGLVLLDEMTEVVRSRFINFLFCEENSLVSTGHRIYNPNKFLAFLCPFALCGNVRFESRELSAQLISNYEF